MADGHFKRGMVLCALSIFGIVVLIAYGASFQLSDLTCINFGFGFFLHVYSIPLSNGSTILGSSQRPFQRRPLHIRHPRYLFFSLFSRFRLPVGSPFSPPKCVPVSSRAAGIPYRAFRRNSQHHLWPLGNLRTCAFAKGLCQSFRLARVLGWTGLFTDDNHGLWLFSPPGIILAIMILPIISSLTREVMTAAPQFHPDRAAGSPR